MLSIGELARRTRISVRMLRHYDALGLVVPERVDPATGYRWYAVWQVGRVNSLVALKELGFTLEQCRAVLDERVSVDGLRGMLRLREAELEQRIRTDAERLAEIARRLRSIERGLTMTNSTLRLAPLPALRLAQVSAEVNDTSEIGAAVGILTSRLAAAGESARIHTYYGRPDGSKIDVAVAVPLEPGAEPVAGLALVELPAEERAAIVTHRGPAEEIGDAWNTLDVGLAERGLESYGPYRQIHLDETGGDGDVVVELQCPVRDNGSGCDPS